MTSVREAVRDLAARKVIGGSSVLVGKMIAFGPREILRAVPLPTGAWTLARLNDRSLDTAVRLLAPG
jgi:hypothetical protein